MRDDKFIRALRRLGNPKWGWIENAPTEGTWHFWKRGKYRLYNVTVYWDSRVIEIDRRW
jgi:hypothetical protein